MFTDKFRIVLAIVAFIIIVGGLLTEEILLDKRVTKLESKPAMVKEIIATASATIIPTVVIKKEIIKK